MLDLINDSSILTVDENVFCDALRCIYFLCKNEIAHTTNFSGLKALCIQQGNKTLPLLRTSGNTNYESEQIMGEMVEAIIGWTLEEQILCEVKNSPFLFCHLNWMRLLIYLSLSYLEFVFSI